MKTCVGTWLKRWSAEIEYFSGPVISGSVVSCVLLLADVVLPARFGAGDRSLQFIEGSVKEAHPVLMMYGLWLLFLCLFLTAWPLTKFIRRFVVLPFLRLCHHLALVGAGAMVALLIAALQHGESGATTALFGVGLVTLLVAGGELQVGVRYCEWNDEKVSTSAPVAMQIGFGLVGLVVLTYVILKMLGAHA